jgi:hypothetical protein
MISRSLSMLRRHRPHKNKHSALFNLVPGLLARRAMEPTPRLYFCLLCYQNALVCRHCDRGQVYCSQSCSQTRRKENMKASSRRYQASFKGRASHARRQARYRARQNKVTHQGSSMNDNDALLSPTENNSENEKLEQPANKPCCFFCGKSVPLLWRRSFIRHKRDSSHSPSSVKGQSP